MRRAVSLDFPRLAQTRARCSALRMHFSLCQSPNALLCPQNSPERSFRPQRYLELAYGWKAASGFLLGFESSTQHVHSEVERHPRLLTLFKRVSLCRSVTNTDGAA